MNYPCPPPPTCQPYQPLPISTGACGLDRCGNVVAYAAPSVVQAPVGWGCWPIQFQGWWLYQGPFSPAAPPYWGGGAPPGWWWPQVNPLELGQIMTGGAALANWMISQRQQAAATPAQRRAA